MTWIDISQPLYSNTAVWPGDTNFQFSLNWTKTQTGSVNVGKLELSTHTGTHIDAPFHFDNEGKKVLDLDINRYIGRALIIDMVGKQSIQVEDLKKVEINGTQIVLFKTMSWSNREQFPTTITYIEQGVASYLADQGIKLVGLDVPSVDPIDSKDLAAHHELTAHDIHILEGLVLDQITEGLYELIAIPLPIKDADASPVRAVIREIT
ncbi:arylformamidase [Bacillus mesophilus]|uniref:Kynurenine formamidase n=1 Tax=Bacillus mesophilus TaxID=1808955 RepID=A0A6M0Q2N6_9BACI|nr:arylformamidase [Bacillus mesophilus]MBM7659582.1 arylformamidase [Bacillus mesophilus]NEY70452.1 arylformamidase [Bacillus mesophilus]